MMDILHLIFHIRKALAYQIIFIYINHIICPFSMNLSIDYLNAGFYEKTYQVSYNNIVGEDKSLLN